MTLFTPDYDFDSCEWVDGGIDLPEFEDIDGLLEAILSFS